MAETGTGRGREASSTRPAVFGIFFFPIKK